MGLSLVKFILPAVSCIAFVPAIKYASQKHLQAEAFIYAFTAVFQMLFHLCEAPGLSILFCLMGKEMLKFVSVLGVVLTTFSTLINLAPHSRSQRLSITLVTCLLTCARLYNTRKGLGIYLGAIVISLIVLVFAWGRRMYASKSLHPDKQTWLRYLLPGFGCISLSYVLLFCVENWWNFCFVHSLHHVSLGVGICFLLCTCNEGERISEDDKFCGGKCQKISCLCCCCA